MWGADENARYLTACLMDFHRRQDKPAWWKLFKCQEATEEELLDDPECLAGLTRVRIDSPVGRAKLPDWVYAYPEQTSKVRAGQKVVRTDTLADVTVLSVDEANRQVTLRPSAKALPDQYGGAAKGHCPIRGRRSDGPRPIRCRCEFPSPRTASVAGANGREAAAWAGGGTLR